MQRRYTTPVNAKQRVTTKAQPEVIPIPAHTIHGTIVGLPKDLVDFYMVNGSVFVPYMDAYTGYTPENQRLEPENDGFQVRILLFQRSI